MPKVSQKRKFFKLWKTIIIDDLLLASLCENDQEKEEYLLDDLMLCLAGEKYLRYGVPFVQNSIPKSHEFMSTLRKLDDEQFRQMFRLTRENFMFILKLIEDDDVFNGPRSCLQLTAENQLLIVLYRLGCIAANASVATTASLFGIAHGGTLQKMTTRVFQAIFKLKKKYLYWPSQFERQQLVNKTKYELPYCIGYLNALKVNLAEKPFLNPTAYYSQEKTYSVKVQAVCDRTLRIRHISNIMPVSANNAEIFNNSELVTQPQQFFNNNEWIAADNSYKLTSTVLTPFKVKSDSPNTTEYLEFNRSLNKYWKLINQCFSQLKSRFRSLNELKLNLKDNASIGRINDWITVCVILHNLLKEKREPDFDDTEQVEDEIIKFERDTIDISEDQEKRNFIFELIKSSTTKT